MRMPRLSVRLATFRGVPVRLHVTFVLLLGFLFWQTGSAVGIRLAAIQSALVVLLLVCVTLHEIGHTAVALGQGIPISEITLFPYGGVARLDRRPATGWNEIKIAAAGPAVNLLIAGLTIGATGGAALTPGNSLPLRVAWLIMLTNLVIAGGNLVPAFPLDGGRVLRGALASGLGWIRATVWAASIGQVTAVVLIVVGAVHNRWLLLGGLLLLPGANSELRLALEMRSLLANRVRDLMHTDVQLVGPDASVAALTQASREAPTAEFIVHDGQSATGYLPAARLWSLLRASGASSSSAGQAALPIGRPVAADAPLGDALGQLDGDSCDVSPVVDEHGTVIGVIRRSALERARRMTNHFAKGRFER